jgi:hypothetical protein
VKAVMNLWVPLNVGKLASGCTTCGLSSDTQLHVVSYSQYNFHISVHIKLKNYILETVFCLRFQVKRTHLGPLDRALSFQEQQHK